MSKDALIQAAGKFLVVGNMEDPNSIAEYILEKTGNDIYYGRNAHYTNQRILKENCWPVQVRAELIAVLTERAKRLEALNASSALIYNLHNRIGRGEFN